MINPIQFIKDVIDILRDPPGEAVAACEITQLTEPLVHNSLDERGRSHIKYGDFYLEMENMSTIVPRDEFHKYYRFDGYEDPEGLTPVIQIKPL